MNYELFKSKSDLINEIRELEFKINVTNHLLKDAEKKYEDKCEEFDELKVELVKLQKAMKINQPQTKFQWR